MDIDVGDIPVHKLEERVDGILSSMLFPLAALGFIARRWAMLKRIPALSRRTMVAEALDKILVDFPIIDPSINHRARQRAHSP